MANDPTRHSRLRHALVVLLTINSGATDAVGFLALGGAFTSVMTGNIVLLGISTRGDGELARHTIVAIGCYVAGCALGARLAGTPQPDDPIWPAAVSRALAIEVTLFTGFAAGWWATGTHPSSAAQLLLLATTAIALGMQSSTVQRFAVPGLSTTYMTGTLTTLVAKLASGQISRALADSGRLLLALLAGAAAARALLEHARTLVPALQLACLATVSLLSIPLVRSPAHPDTSPARSS